MSSLFGGLDLGTPADRNRLTLTRELKVRCEREPFSGWGKVYPTGAHLLLDHGKFYVGQPMPDEYLHLCGPVGECYWTAMKAAEAVPSLRYCEGIVAASGGRYLSHGWCLTPDDKVLDFTWNGSVGYLQAHTKAPILSEDHWGYWGVVLRPELARTQDEMPMLGRDMASESTDGVREVDGRWVTQTGLEISPPSKLPLLDYPYNPDRTEFPHA